MVTVGVAADTPATVSRVVAMILERVFVDISFSLCDLRCVQERRRDRRNITNRIRPASSRPMFFYIQRYFLPCACAGLPFAAIPVDIGKPGFISTRRGPPVKPMAGACGACPLCGPLMLVER